MTNFLAVRPVNKELTLEAATPIAKTARAHSTLDAYWVRTWHERAEGKLYCEWDAKDADSTRRVCGEGALDFPVAGIYEVENMVDSEDFR